MRRYDIARFAVAHDSLTEGDRVELYAIGVVIDGVINVRAATLTGPEQPPRLGETEPVGDREGELCAD